MGLSQGADFFISYTAVNEPWATWIGAELERAGYRTVVQSWDARPGIDFVHMMQQAVTGAARTVVALSPAYFGSRFGEAEWRAAFAQDPTGELGLLIPVRVQPCEPPGLLASRMYIDLVDLDEQAARRRLLAGVTPDGARPITVPFPGGPASGGGASGGPRFPGLGPPLPVVAIAPIDLGIDPQARRLRVQVRPAPAARVAAGVLDCSPAAFGDSDDATGRRD